MTPNRSAVFFERDAVVGRALRRWAAASGHFELTGVAREMAEGLHLSARLRPRLALVDLAVSSMERAEDDLTALRGASPGVLVIVFSDPQFRIPALDLPIDDFVTRPHGLGRMPEEGVVAALTSRLRYVGELVPEPDIATA